MIRLALVGCGNHSRGSHATPLARYVSEHPDRVELAAACDLDIGRAKEFCDEFGFARAYGDMAEMLSGERIDGCVCVMPVKKIAAVAIDLLNRRVPCVVEKPLGVSTGEISHLATVARATGTPHMVSVNRRFNPYLRRALAWARGQGEIRFVRGAMFRRGRTEPEFVWGTAMHAVDTLRFIGGEVRHWGCRVQKGDGLSTKWYSAEFQFERGCVGRLDILPTSGMHEESYELFGEGFRASVFTKSERTALVKCWRDNRCELEVASPRDEPTDVLVGAYDETVEFVEALLEHRPPRPSIADVLPSAEICFRMAECG